MNLGRALMRTGDFEAAATAFEHVAQMQPNIVDAHIFLTIAYNKANRTQDVIKECQAVLHYMPDNFGANLSLGRALLKTGDAEGAISPLQKAVAGEPDKPAPHLSLADVYEKLGRTEDAQRERAEASRLGTAAAGSSDVAPNADGGTGTSVQQR
jgi:Flp pilus assembly protein TadD